MASTYFTVVTDSGTRKMIEAVNRGEKIKITEVAVGDGGGEYYTPERSSIRLKNEVWRGPANACYISKEYENLIVVESAIPSNVGGFTIREMGVFDKDGTLIAICNTPDTQKIKISDGAVYELNLSMELALVNTDIVELDIDPNVVMATKKDVERLQLKVNAQLEKLDNDKVDKVVGKGLSTNDYTTMEKEKLEGIAPGANNYTLPVATSSARGGVKIGYTASGKNYSVQLSEDEKMYVNVPWTDTTYNDATQSVHGLMSVNDKKKLDGIESGAQKNPTNYITGGSQTTSSTADGGSNVFTFNKADGTSATFTVKNGSTGSQGPQGDTGTRGSIINWGISVIGTSSIGTAFNTGISSSLVNDLYINTNTWNIYQCTVAGNTSTAKWAYKGNIKGANGTNGTNGAKGDKGDKGDAGTRGSMIYCGSATVASAGTGIFFIPDNNIGNALVGDLYINTSSWGVYQCLVAGNASSAVWKYIGYIKGATGNTGSQGAKGDKGDTGAQGVSISKVEQTTTSTADGGNNVVTVTLSNGVTSTITIKNGSKGSQGAQGSAANIPSGLTSGYVRTGQKAGTTTGYNATMEGESNTASGWNAHAEGSHNIASGDNAHAGGYVTTASNYGSCSIGKRSKQMVDGGNYLNQAGDAFVIGNGTSDTNKSNAFRVTFLGDILGTKAFQSSGADYAEFKKPWADNNPNNEDRVGYFVTIKNGLLYKANEGDYITGITSGNPSIVGNADEDYYWRYERDEFNRIVMEDVPEIVQLKDEDGNPVFDEETHEPVMIETGNMIPNARMKLADDYDSSKQNEYIPRAERKEWDYVGMCGVIPVRDDGTCLPDHFCKCGQNGIATLATERGFDTFFVIERLSENIVSVDFK